jgi:hypothetical protein
MLCLIELKGAAYPVDDGLGDPGRVAALKSDVVLRTHAGEQGDLFAVQTLHPPATAEVGQPRFLRGRAFSPQDQELADVVPVVHAVASKSCSAGIERVCVGS